MEWKDLSNAEHVIEITKLAAEFRIHILRKPGPITVRVYEHPDGRFEGVSNYSIKAPGQKTPYKSIHFMNTVEEALYDSIAGLLALYPKDKEEQKKTEWIKDEDF